MIVIVGDLHFRNEEPFYTSGELFANWLLSRYPDNGEDTIVFLGDLLDEAVSNGKVNRLMNDLFQGLSFGTKIIIQGNHDYSRSKGSGLLPLRLYGAEIFDYWRNIIIEGYDFLLLPYFYPFTISNDSRMEIDYPALKERFPADSFDFLLTHVADESQTMFKSFIDLSYFKATRISGHVHMRSQSYLGSSIITRYDERHKDSFIAEIDSEINYVEVPMFLDYYDLKFGDRVPKVKAPCSIWNILEAPSVEEAKDKYHNLSIRNVETLKKKSSGQSIAAKAASSIDEYLLDFCKTNKVDPKVESLLVETIRRRRCLK